MKHNLSLAQPYRKIKDLTPNCPQIVAGLRLYIDVNEVWMGKIDLRAG